ncbi:hypothetical protein BGX23_005276 [Mortierella sp. AD031]|nr:hypothetical protein BGX23_005276 [Mortierella sp. AD031]
MEILESPPSAPSLTTAPTDTATWVFSPPVWTIPTRTGPLYPGRPKPSTFTDNPLPPPTATDGTTVPTNPTEPPTASDGGGGILPGITPGPIGPSATVSATVSASSTSLSGGVVATPRPTATGLGNLGQITLQPGSPTTIATTPLASSSSDACAIASGSFTGILFAFAFVGAMIIGFAAGIAVMRYTRFGRRGHKKEQGELAEQLRLLTNTLGDRNERLDREEKYVQAAASQGDFMPSWYHSRHYSSIFPDRLHPQSVPDQSAYQDWGGLYAAAGSPLTPGSPMVSLRQSSTLRQPRVINLPPSQVGEIYGPKSDWSSNGGSSPLSPSHRSAPDLHGFENEKRCPQIQEEGQGEDSLFDVGNPMHNPHVTSKIF